jgi:hypothetical protein
VHASISHFPGDPDDLLSRYDALLAEVPAQAIQAHLCLRAADGIVVVDTCPSEEAFRQFHLGGTFAAMRERHGLPDPDRVDDFPLHVAITGGVALAS